MLALIGVAVATPRAQETTARIPVRIIVTDARGKDVKGLSAADVQISEGKQPQTVQSLVPVPAGPRKIGILLDEYHVAAGESTERARSALLQFVERFIRPEDVVLVMKPLDPAALLAPLKSVDALRETISTFAGVKDNFAPRNAFEAEFMSTLPPTAPRQRAQVVRAAMQALVTAMARSEEKATASSTLIVVSEGFSSEDRGRERLVSLRTVTRSARMSNVAVYVVDPAPMPPSQSPFNDAWRQLVGQTGGVLTTNAAPLEPALSRLAADLDSHYVAIIAPTFKEDGAYHPIEISVKRREVAVRAPAGYWTPIAAERYTPPVRPDMSTYLKTPHISGLIQPWFRMARAGTGRTQVIFLWAPKGKVQATTVSLSAVTLEGVKLHDSVVAPQSAGAEGRAAFDAAPGPIQVAMQITDARGKVLDTEVRYLDVPRLETTGAMIMSVDFVRTRTLREFLERQTQAETMPAETRDFDRHDRLIVRVRALGRAGASPDITARLLNTRGQPMRDLPALPSVDGIPQFDLSLAPFARGDYHIEIKARSGSATVSQLVTFRLVG